MVYIQFAANVQVLIVENIIKSIKIEKSTYSKQYRAEHKQQFKEYTFKNRLAALKRIAMAHGSIMVYCIHCGFTDLRALQIDHINGGGTKELDSKRTYAYYKEITVAPLDEIKKNYQILCANCNSIKKEENRENYKWKEKT